MTTLGLAQAIKLGAMIRPQAFGTLFDGIGSCALGAAMEAVGIPLDEAHMCPPAWEAFLNGFDTCPECGTDMGGLVVVAHLNDVHLWTRERIADYVEGVENVLQAPVEDEALVPAGVE